jgi:hypothetical protein
MRQNEPRTLYEQVVDYCAELWAHGQRYKAVRQLSHEWLMSPAAARRIIEKRLLFGPSVRISHDDVFYGEVNGEYKVLT